tara:strand:- start:1087 stop:1905 length:819 start_codon:yes stop_codon:yes gene_type:complete
MKLRHNKKRNTAFLYETVIKELTKAIFKENKGLVKQLTELLVEHFKKNTVLRKELNLYKSLYETRDVSEKIAEKLIFEVRVSHQSLDKKQIFLEQSALIKKMNKIISKNAFSNFVPNYKSLATIYQIFNDETPAKSRVLLEDNISKRLSSKKINEEEMKSVDDIVYRTFVSKFNEEYKSKLLNEQRELLSKYISSFVDNGIELKIFLNEEVSRLKQTLVKSLRMKEVQEDQGMLNKTKDVLDLLENFKKTKINKTLVEKILKIQNLVKEINN